VALWHDHRVHWMSLERPPQLGNAASGRVLDWTVKIEVDGQPAVIAGHLDLRARCTMAVASGAGRCARCRRRVLRRPRLAAPVSAAASLAVLGLRVANPRHPGLRRRSYASIAFPPSPGAAITAWVRGEPATTAPSWPGGRRLAMTAG
jgi:hypothetical protein